MGGLRCLLLLGGLVVLLVVFDRLHRYRRFDLRDLLECIFHSNLLDIPLLTISKERYLAEYVTTAREFIAVYALLIFETDTAIIRMLLKLG